MLTDELSIIEVGHRLLMRHFDPTVPGNGIVSEKAMECRVLSVTGRDQFKLSIPTASEEPWMPSLDGGYVFSVVIEEVNYSGKGRITERFRDEEGDCCIFKMTEALSIEERKEFLQLSTSLNAMVETPEESEGIEGQITLLSLNFMIFEGGVFIEDESSLSLTVILENGKEIRADGVVSETIRLRNGNYQSRILISRMDIKCQRDLSLWILQHNKKAEK